MNLLQAKLGGLVSVPCGIVPAAPPSTGLVARYRADLGITKDGSDRVSAWADQSGNGYTISQATGTNQPLWVTSVVNGKPIVRFARSRPDRLTRSGPPTTLAAPYTWIVICARTTDGASQWFCSRQGGFTGMLYNASNQLALFAGSTFTTGVSTDNAFHSIIGIINGASSEGFIDNTSTGTGNAGSSALTGIELGSADSGTDPFSGDMAEVLLYDHAVDSTERTTLDNYVASQYGI